MFIRAMVRIFSFGERWNVPVASSNGTFHLSPNENILTIAQINIHYLYTIIYNMLKSLQLTHNHGQEFYCRSMYDRQLIIDLQ